MNVDELRAARANGTRPEAPWANLRGANLYGADLREADLYGANLYGANLYGADLRGANLRGANLYGADLRGADLYGANLYGANLYGADLRGADLYGANLYGANLYGADLRGADLILQIRGLPSGELVLFPTPQGWRLYVGCWGGTPAELKELVKGDKWPEATGAEQEYRRKWFRPAFTMINLHIARYPNVITELAEKWADK